MSSGRSSKAPLVPCVDCGQHVRVDETACPHCGKALDPTKNPPAGGLGAPQPPLPPIIAPANRYETMESSAGIYGAPPMLAPMYGGPPGNRFADRGGKKKPFKLIFVAALGMAVICGLLYALVLRG